jgi:hypothetical protein
MACARTGAIVLLVCSHMAHAGLAPERKCAVAKQKAVGKAIAARMSCHARAKLTGTPLSGECVGRADTKLTAAITKAGISCPGTAADVATMVDACIEALAADVPGDGSCPSTSAKVAGKWGKSLMGCTAREIVRPGSVAACDARTDAKDQAALTKAGGCAASTTHADLHSACIDPLSNTLPPTSTSSTTTSNTSTTTTSTLPTCAWNPFLHFCEGGCAANVSCQVTGTMFCSCVAPGDCAGSAAPTCGGNCPAGQACFPYRDPGGLEWCSCGDPNAECSGTSLPCSGIACPPGFLCDITFSTCSCESP